MTAPWVGPVRFHGEMLVSSRLCDSMFIKTLLFDALVFMRVPAIPVKS